MCPKETNRSNFHVVEDSNGYEFYIVGRVLKITHGEILLKMGRSMGRNRLIEGDPELQVLVKRNPVKGKR